MEWNFSISGCVFLFCLFFFVHTLVVWHFCTTYFKHTSILKITDRLFVLSNNLFSKQALKFAADCKDLQVLAEFGTLYNANLDSRRLGTGESENLLFFSFLLIPQSSKVSPTICCFSLSALGL